MRMAWDQHSLTFGSGKGVMRRQRTNTSGFLENPWNIEN